MDPQDAPQPERVTGPGMTDTRDRVMWLFALIAGILLVLAVLTVALLAIFRPEADTGELAKSVSTQISLIVGAVLGYAARGPATPTNPPGDG
jgi:heme/copper-type cytochrome/quinol oxidase subunit 2